MFRTKVQHTACQSCPIARTADLIGDSTILLIVRDLAKAPQRFTELQASSAGVSSRTLTKKLDILQKEGLISKCKYPEFPPRVEYALTKKGKGLLRVIHAMEQYGVKHLS
ncbi:MAG: helix-turn-helix transcriptional regulator [Candidatus Kaiserbacteria bacterium]|nr:helix-turn-helix transcriptional regulator [Candidatus Kaiserbacteria bacterium]